MDYKNKSIINKLYFVSTVLFLIVSIFFLFRDYNYSNTGTIEKVFLMFKSLFPDKTIELNSLKLTLEQPFIFGKEDSTDSYLAFYEFGTVEYLVASEDENISWEKSALNMLNDSDFMDISATLYEYCTSEGPVYLLFDFDSLSFIEDHKHGYKTTGLIMIPNKKLIVSIYKSREGIEFFLEFAKPFISDDPNIKLELTCIYYGGKQEW